MKYNLEEELKLENELKELNIKFELLKKNDNLSLRKQYKKYFIANASNELKQYIKEKEIARAEARKRGEMLD